jgi:hypothetical protein
MDGTVSTSAKLWPQRFDAAVVLVKHIFYCGLIVGKNVWQNSFGKKTVPKVALEQLLVSGKK